VYKRNKGEIRRQTKLNYFLNNTRRSIQLMLGFLNALIRKRIHFVELHELSWFPKNIRIYLTGTDLTNPIANLHINSHFMMA